MKIIDIKTHMLEADVPKPFCWALAWANKRYTMLTEVITDEGIIGWGEAFCALQPPQIPASIVEHVFKE
jgi:D-galactarolactone cycloisomerase